MTHFINPYNPYPDTPDFLDVPGVDIPIILMQFPIAPLPPSVSTAATQRIGMEARVLTNSKSSLALTASDGAKFLELGSRIGAVTVFGDDENPGFPTDKVDSRRQGISVRTYNQFDKILVPLIRLTNNPLVSATPFINHTSNPEAYGQSKLFHNPIYDSAKYAFTDIEGRVNPVTYVKMGGYYPAYPIILDLPVYIDPEQMNGVIEVFDVRRSFSNTSITDYNFMKGAHGTMMGGSIDWSNKGTAEITSKFEVKKENEIDFFEDSQDTLFGKFNFPSASYSSPGLTDRKFDIPGIVSTGRYEIPPYNDAVAYTTGSYDEFGSIVSAQVALLSTTKYYNLAKRFQAKTGLTDAKGKEIYDKWEVGSEGFVRGLWRPIIDISGGGNISDSSGNGFTASPVTSISTSQPAFDLTYPSTFIVEEAYPGPPGRSLSSAGTSNFSWYATPSGKDKVAVVPDNSALSFIEPNTFSISAWVKLGNNTIGQSTILAKGSSGGAYNGEYQFAILANGTMKLLLTDSVVGRRRGRSGNATVPEVLLVKPAVWCHVICTYDGRGGANPELGIKFYLNAVEETAYVTQTGGAGTYVSMRDTAYDVTIGAVESSPPGSGIYVLNFDGNIAEIALFSKELTATEVLTIYNAGINGIRTDYPDFEDLLYGNNVKGPYSRMSAIGTRFKSATCGLQFGESNVLGTDSIAFGGLKK